MNAYGRVFDLKGDANAQGMTDATEMARAHRMLQEASQAARTHDKGRRFHSTIETRYFSGAACRELWVGDLLSITTIKMSAAADQPSTFDYTLTAGTDYTLWPRNAASEGKPYRKVILNPAGQFSAFTLGVDNIQIVGKFGFSEIKEAVVGAAQITGTVATDSGLTITASATVAAMLSVGDQIFLGDEEMGPILSVSTTSIVVQARGINGTTAAAHSPAVAMYLRRYPDDLERAVRTDAARHLWGSSQGYPEGTFREKWPAIAQTLDSYTDPAGYF